MNIPQMIGTNYGTFGTLLLNDRQGETIVDDNSRAKEINMAILVMWGGRTAGNLEDAGPSSERFQS